MIVSIVKLRVPDCGNSSDTIIFAARSLNDFIEFMLINEDWSAPQRVEYSKNILLRFSKGGFLARISNATGSVYEVAVTEGKEFEIRASEISHIAHPSISFKSQTKEEIHVRVEEPAY